jgi:hypothetical protein
MSKVIGFDQATADKAEEAKRAAQREETAQRNSAHIRTKPFKRFGVPVISMAESVPLEALVGIRKAPTEKGFHYTALVKTLAYAKRQERVMGRIACDELA